MKSYNIHFNGSKPYTVIIDNDVKVYKNGKEFVLCLKNPENIYIGKSPKNSITISSKGYGKKFLGNTILINTKMNDHVFISNMNEIYNFKTDSPIISYTSPVGNNDIPYPIAYTSTKIYLLINKICIDISDMEKYGFTGDNPYNFYYKNIKKLKKSKNKYKTKTLFNF